MIRAMFTVLSVTKHGDGSESVDAQAVSGRSGTANAQWSKWTPNGRLTMTINNPDAQGKLLPGKSYYLDLTEATAEA